MRGIYDTDLQREPTIALPMFFVFTFAFTWIVWLAPVALVTPGNSWLLGVGGPVFLLGIFAPAFAALALTAFCEGSPGVVRLLRRIGKWELGARWYLFAISYMAVTKLLAALIHRFIVGAWPTFGETSVPLMLGAILISTWVQAGEEIGWRGFALPRLAIRIGPGGASVLLGVIWALWHLPLFFLASSGSEGQSFPLYLLHVTSLSVAMAWLYFKTEGSLLLVMLMHASVNNTTGIVPAAVPNAVDPLSFKGSLVGWLTVGVSWAVAVLLLWCMRTVRFKISDDKVVSIAVP